MNLLNKSKCWFGWHSWKHIRVIVEGKYIFEEFIEVVFRCEHCNISKTDFVTKTENPKKYKLFKEKYVINKQG